MHGTIGQNAETAVFVDLPDVVESPISVGVPAAPRQAYGAGRRPNWFAIGTIAALHAVLLVGLVQFDIVAIRKKAPPLVVIDIADAAPPPPEDKPKPEVKPDPAVPQIVTPPPVVATIAPAPPPIAAAPPPLKPAPPTSAPQAQGPVTVANLDEKLIEGDAPRYPMESRRKKEQGTVVLRVLIGTDGRIEQISVAESSGFDRLDQAALLAVKHWRWKPEVRDGQPVELRGTLRFPFSIT